MYLLYIFFYLSRWIKFIIGLTVIWFAVPHIIQYSWTISVAFLWQTTRLIIEHKFWCLTCVCVYLCVDIRDDEWSLAGLAVADLPCQLTTTCVVRCHSIAEKAATSSRPSRAECSRTARTHQTGLFVVKHSNPNKSSIFRCLLTR